MYRSHTAQIPVLEPRFSLFGPVSMCLGSQELRLRTRKFQALLAYLLLEPGMHSRTKLATLLWPDANEEVGRARLRTALSNIKKNLGPVTDLITANKEAVGFKPGGAWVDVGELETAFKHAGQNQEVGLETTLQAAAKLYRGEFLEGFSLEDAREFDDWLVARRELAKQWLDTVLERLAELQAGSGRLPQSVETAQRRVHLEPLNEAAHQQLIALHLQMGNRGAAQGAYQFCRTILESELGLAPSPQTEALLAVLGNAPATEAPKSQPSTAPSSQQTRLVGRDAAWTRIEEAWAKGQTIFISGEAGLGKTRLVQEFMAPRNGPMLYRSARPSETSVPYASLAENLRGLLAVLPGLPIDAWARQELSRILPELVEKPQAMSGQTDKLRFFNAIAQVMTTGFSSLSTMVLDDLQFYDAASLEITVFVNSRLAELGVAGKPNRLIGLFRPSEVSAVWMEGVRNLLERDLAVLIELEALEVAAIGQMLGDLVPDNSNLTELAPALHRFTGGNPMFMVETVRTLAQRGSLENLNAKRFEARRQVAGLPRSPKVTVVIGRRLERLSSSATNLSRVAAILGEQFTVERAAKVLDASLLSLAPACEELEAAQVWRGQKFSHDLLYETTLEAIPQSLLPILHGRVLDVLEGSNAAASVLAHHAIAAGNEEASFRYSYQAGVEAFNLFAVPDAMEQLERVRKLGRAAPQLWGLISELERYSMYDILLQGYGVFGLHKPMLKKPLVAEMTELKPHIIDADVGRRLDLSLAHEHFWATWDARLVVQVAQEQLQHFEQTHDLLRQYHLLFRLGMVNGYINQYSQGLTFFSRALEVARKLNDEGWVGNYVERLGSSGGGGHSRPASSLVGQCLELIGGGYRLLGEWDWADESMAEAALYLTENERTILTQLNYDRASNLLLFGRPRQALPILTNCLEICQQAHDQTRVGYVRSLLIRSLLEIGEYSQANTHVLLHTRIPTISDTFRGPGALCFLKLGPLENARSILNEEKEHTGLSAPHLECGKFSLAAGLYALEGNWSKACHYALRAFEARQALGFERFFISPFVPRWLETEALLRGGQEDLARESLHSLDEASQPYERLRLTYLRSLAVLETWEGQTGEAIGTLQEALALAQKMDLPGELWEIEAKLAELFLANGEPQKAQEARDSALAGIQWLADRIEDVEVKRGFLEFTHSQLSRAAQNVRT